MKSEVQEIYNEIDPFNEEDWDENGNETVYPIIRPLEDFLGIDIVLDEIINRIRTNQRKQRDEAIYWDNLSWWKKIVNKKPDSVFIRDIFKRY